MLELVITDRLVLWVPLLGGSLEWVLGDVRPVRLVVLVVAALGAARCKYIWLTKLLCLYYPLCFYDTFMVARGSSVAVCVRIVVKSGSKKFVDARNF